ncbi:MAG: hypothetical protein WC758_08135 [Candidatus Woesearchaeota archaeon]|jgi:hypothetical protein
MKNSKCKKCGLELHEHLNRHCPITKINYFEPLEDAREEIISKTDKLSERLTTPYEEKGCSSESVRYSPSDTLKEDIYKDMNSLIFESFKLGVKTGKKQKEKEFLRNIEEFVSENFYTDSSDNSLQSNYNEMVDWTEMIKKLKKSIEGEKRG